MDITARQKVNNYKFERKSSEMGKAFGTIKKGNEGAYALQLFSMEGNLLKINRIRQVDNGRRAIEAVRICLFTIDGYIRNVAYDLDEYLADDVSSFARSLLMAFDPFVNKGIPPIAGLKGVDGAVAPESLREYFEVPVKCLLRIESSIEVWTKRFGINGYFNFLEESIGHKVNYDDKMDFAIKVGNLSGSTDN
jgi:hypothetical protein